MVPSRNGAARAILECRGPQWRSAISAPIVRSPKLRDANPARSISKSNHGLHFRVFGATGGLEWFQEEPNQLRHSRLGQPAIVFERHGPGLKPAALRASRIGIGHPEGFQEAFAVLYAEAAEAIVARRQGQTGTLDFPTVEDGARTMKFIDAALESSRSGRWVDCRLDPA